MPNAEKIVTIIAGPTASGKTKFALEYAENNNGVIINADSQQLYKSLPILTAQPDANEQARCPHYLYGVLGNDDYMSASLWAKTASEHIKNSWDTGKHPILVGGTGFYLKALMDGFSPIPEIPLSVRNLWIKNFEDRGADNFFNDLKRDDPVIASRLHKHDKQRLIRAREVLDHTQKSLSEWQNIPHTQILPEAFYKFYILKPARDILYERCNKRIYSMIQQGVLTEVQSLMQTLKNADAPVTKALGFKEFQNHLKGNINLNDAIEQTALITRHYAKRQVTWFNNQIKPQENILSIEIIHHVV